MISTEWIGPLSRLKPVMTGSACAADDASETAQSAAKKLHCHFWTSFGIILSLGKSRHCLRLRIEHAREATGRSMSSKEVTTSDRVRARRLPDPRRGLALLL